MNPAKLNFEMIVKSRELDSLLISASDLFELTRRQLALLRTEEAVAKRDPEVDKVREDLNTLLGVLSLLEIGNIANALPKRLPEDLDRTTSGLLNHPDVKYYYDNVRPMLLIESLRRRLNGEQKLHERNERDCLVIFMSFAHSEPITREPDVKEFGRLLAGGLVGRDEYDFASFLRIFDDVEGLWARMSRSSEDADALDRSLQAFQKFYAFARGFRTLLEEAGAYTLLQSSMWHYHGFWFRLNSETLTTVFDRFCESIVVWAGQSAEEKAEATETALETRAFLAQLADETKYGTPLCKALQRTG